MLKSNWWMVREPRCKVYYALCCSRLLTACDRHAQAVQSIKSSLGLVQRVSRFEMQVDIAACVLFLSPHLENTKMW